MLSPEELQAVGLSLKVALVAVAFSFPAGLWLAWVLARKSFRGKAVVETLLNLPLVLPPVVVGYLLLISFSPTSGFGKLLSGLGIEVVFDWKGAALASAVVSFPLMVRSMRVAFSGLDMRLIGAARTLGAKPFDAFRSVALPLAKHGVLAGCVLAFARSMGEFGATIMIAGSIPGETRTVPLFVYEMLQTPGGASSAQRIVIVSILVAALALFASEYLERRSCRA